MEDIRITDKENKGHTLKIDESSLFEDSKDGFTSMSVKYEVHGPEGFEGHGTFKIKYRSDNVAMSSKRAWDELIGLGSQSIEKAVQNKEDLVSKGYNFSIL